MSEELCDGVKMLIERMQTNPEDFDYDGKLQAYSNTMEDILRNPKDYQPLWFLSDVEKKALIDAYRDTHRARFTAGVVQSIFAPEPQYDVNMDRRYQKPSKTIATPYVMQQAKQILEKEFEKEYAKQTEDPLLTESKKRYAKLRGKL